jgi:hypothetical protein
VRRECDVDLVIHVEPVQSLHVSYAQNKGEITNAFEAFDVLEELLPAVRDRRIFWQAAATQKIPNRKRHFRLGNGWVRCK